METVEDHLADRSDTSYNLACPDTNTHIKKLEISLDSRSNHYSSGDTVSGRVRFLNVQCVQSKGVFREVRGQYEVNIASFNESKEYFNNGECLYRPERDALQMDQYELPFSVQLPQNIPSTYHGEYGGVSYYLKIEIYGETSLIVSHELELILTSRLNLNHESKARARVFQGIHPFSAQCCSSPGRLEVSIDLPKSGFIPTENIFIDGFIHNKSNRIVTICEIKLIERAEYHGIDGEEDIVSETRRVLKQDVVTGLTANTSRQWEQVVFEVPANLPPSGLKHCDGIELNYFLHFSFIPKDNSDVFEVELPIMIGTIPIDLEYDKPSLETSRYGALEQPPDYDTATAGKHKVKKSKRQKAAEFFNRIKTPAQKLQDGTLSNEERVALLKNASNNLMKGKGSKETFNFPEPDSLNPLSI